jgi:hypothetical protein
VLDAICPRTRSCFHQRGIAMELWVGLKKQGKLLVANRCPNLLKGSDMTKHRPNHGRARHPRRREQPHAMVNRRR